VEIIMDIDYNDYWNPEYFVDNIEDNKKNVENTINDLSISEKKIMLCGRGETQHPNFHPRFSTPTTNLESELYVTTDHDPNYVQYINKKGSYALSLIVNPVLPKKIKNLGGKIYWFSHKEIKSDVPVLLCGEFPKENSGLAAISLASHVGVKSILLSGIKFTDSYSQFLSGKELVFEQIKKQGTNIYSLDGLIAEQINFQKWCEM
jgi:hypothetical protein